MMESGMPLVSDNQITGVLVKPLRTFRDERGFFREVVRDTDPFFNVKVGDVVAGSGEAFRQWSHSRMTHDVVKAWHYHHVQFYWWYLAIGQIETVLFDNRPESPSYKKRMVFKMGDAHIHGEDTLEVCVRIPPGVLHGLRVISAEAHLFYITSEIYSPNEEGRFPYDSELVGHLWGENPIVVENDRKHFVPTSTRKLIA